MDQAQRETIEREIEHLIATAQRAGMLHNLLFTPQGLFNRLAKTREEREELSKTSLFRRALSRVSDLELEEAKQFAEAVQRIEESIGTATVRTPASV